MKSDGNDPPILDLRILKIAAKLDG
jgi:hypothetical protein